LKDETLIIIYRVAFIVATMIATGFIRKHQQLQETIQTLHRKAVDADQILDNLQRDQKGKFAAVFADDSGFTTSAKRFGPYVQEIASDWQALKELDDDAAKQALAPLVKKIELALVTIAQFQQSLSKS